MNSKIEKVQGYKTTDGIIHDDLATAEIAQSGIDFREGLDELVEKDTDVLSTERQTVIDFVIKNGIKLRALLESVK